jgi:hypothetical protein
VTSILASRSCVDNDSRREPTLGGNQRELERQPREFRLWLTTLTNLAGEPVIEAVSFRSVKKAMVRTPARAGQRYAEFFSPIGVTLSRFVALGRVSIGIAMLERPATSFRARFGNHRSPAGPDVIIRTTS